MLKSLTGTEPGLAGLWNFNAATNGIVKDLTPGGHDGRLVGNAQIAPGDQPSDRAQSGPSQSASLERVLQLDGKSGFVELPPLALRIFLRV